MRKLVVVLASAAVGALTMVGLSGATTHATTWTAGLSSGQSKQVVKTPSAHGLFKGTLRGTTLTWKLTFSKLSGPSTAAHIHMAARGKSGPIVVPLCAPCTSGVTGTATISPALLADFKKHLLYVNVHTAKNPDGEIRGQLAVG